MHLVKSVRMFKSSGEHEPEELMAEMVDRKKAFSLSKDTFWKAHCRELGTF